MDVAAAAADLDRHCTYCDALLMPVFGETTTSLSGSGSYWHVQYEWCECTGVDDYILARERAKDKEEDRRQAEHLKAALISAGLGGWLGTASFDTFTERENWPDAMAALVRIRHYTEAVIAGDIGDRAWLILHGRYGTGKTHLSAAAIRHALLQGVGGAYFRSWTEYLKRLQASWDREPGEERTSDIVAELQRGRLVAIDDLDKKEPRSGWAIEELYTVLNYRYNENLPTILTFNCAPDEIDPKAPGRLMLERYMGRAIIDRVIGARYDVVNFDGPSYRSGVTW